MIRGGRSRNTRVKPEAPTVPATTFKSLATVKAVLTTSAGVSVTTPAEDGRTVVYVHDLPTARLLEEIILRLDTIGRGLEPETTP